MSDTPKQPLDPLLARQSDPYPPARVHYALGTLLGVDDFRDEQNYHRGRLARALAYLFGAGTVAGLKIAFAYDEKNPTNAARHELRVTPGLAIDVFGRLIEVRQERCLRIERWLAEQSAGELDAAARPTGGARAVAWLFIRARPCATGRTPVLAEGPVDATNATAPSRTSEECELGLFLDGKPGPSFTREGKEGKAYLSVGRRTLPDDSELARQLQTAILNGWGDPPTDNPDIGWLLLGRVEIAITGARAYDVTAAEHCVVPDNYQRPFVYSGWALALAADLPLPPKTVKPSP